MLLRMAVVSILAFTAACSPAARPPPTPTPPPIRLADIRALPVSALRMPGADELLHEAQESGGFIADLGPFEGGYYGTQATPAEVYAFYDHELRGRGWVRAGGRYASTPMPTPGSADPGVWVWCRPRAGSPPARDYQFIVSVVDQRDAYARIHNATPPAQPVFAGQTYRTTFSAFVRTRWPNWSCP